MFKNEKGFTLTELIVGMMIASAVSYGSYQVYGIYHDHKMHTERMETQKLLMGALTRIGSRATRMIRWTAFDTSRSYFYAANNEDMDLTTWTWDDIPFIQASTQGIADLSTHAAIKQQIIDNQKFIFVHKDNEYAQLLNDSFTLEMMNEEGGTQSQKVGFQDDNGNGVQDAGEADIFDQSVTGMLISRCIPKGDIKKRFSLQELLDLERAPFAYYLDGKTLEVHCCNIGEPMGDTICSDGDVLDTNSNWRVRSYHITPDRVNEYPKYGDIRYITNAGWALYFDKAAGVKSYRMIVFSTVNRCQSKIDLGYGDPNCKGTRIVKKEVLTDFLESDFGSSGIIKIDK